MIFPNRFYLFLKRVKLQECGYWEVFIPSQDTRKCCCSHIRALLGAPKGHGGQG